MGGVEDICIDCVEQVGKKHLLSYFTFSKETDKKEIYLKTVDNFGNCQRPVFSLGISQHMHKITNLDQIELDWSSKLGDVRKTV